MQPRYGCCTYCDLTACTSVSPDVEAYATVHLKWSLIRLCCVICHRKCTEFIHIQLLTCALSAGVGSQGSTSLKDEIAVIKAALSSEAAKLHARISQMEQQAESLLLARPGNSNQPSSSVRDQVPAREGPRQLRDASITNQAEVDLHTELAASHETVARLRSEVEAQQQLMEDALTREADTVTELQESIEQLEEDVRVLRERLDEAETRAEAASRDAEHMRDMLQVEKARLEEALIREVRVLFLNFAHSSTFFLYAS
jgi:hypothetical protein